MNVLHKIAFTLLIIGGLNWFLLGVFSWDIGEIFGGQGAVVSRIIYILVGLAAIYEIFTHTGRCRDCKSGGEKVQMSQPSSPSSSQM